MSLLHAPPVQHEVAETILSQIGGPGRWVRFVGAKQILTRPDGVTIKYTAKGRAGNCFRITYNHGDDLYTLEFLAIRGLKVKTVETVTGVYAEQLLDIFEGRTGLYLTLSPRR